MTPHAQDTETWISFLRDVDPKTYLDIGAGDGYDCAQVKAAFPDCRCIAIEPVEEWEVDTVERHRDVIGRSNFYSVFHVKTQAGIHGMYGRFGVTDKEVVAKPVRTLAHFCEREGIDHIDAMKIDVEGAAYDVIAGGLKQFATVKAVHIETEWLELFAGQRLERDVFRLLSDVGLTKVWENRVEELGQGDSIWVRR